MCLIWPWIFCAIPSVRTYITRSVGKPGDVLSVCEIERSWKLKLQRNPPNTSSKSSWESAESVPTIQLLIHEDGTQMCISRNKNLWRKPLKWLHRKRQTMLYSAVEILDKLRARNGCASSQTVTSAVPEKGKGSLVTPKSYCLFCTDKNKTQLMSH